MLVDVTFSVAGEYRITMVEAGSNGDATVWAFLPIFMDDDDMRARGLEDFDLVDVTSFSARRHDAIDLRISGRPLRNRGRQRRRLHAELNVLCGHADFSTQSGQPVTKHLVVTVTKQVQGPTGLA